MKVHRTTSSARRAAVIAVACVGLGGCALSGGSASGASKTTLPGTRTGASVTTFRTFPFSPTTSTTAGVPNKPPVISTNPDGTPAAEEGIYKVKTGDTLSGIARTLNVNLQDLLDVNELTLKSFITIGQRLKIPGAAISGDPTTPTGTTPPGAKPAATTRPPTTVPKVQASSQTYTVISGDTFSGIATKLGVPMADLLSVNNMNTNSLIVPGQKLKVPVKHA